MKENGQYTQTAGDMSGNNFRSADPMTPSQSTVEGHILRDATNVKTSCHAKCSNCGNKGSECVQKNVMDRRKNLKQQVKLTRDYIRYLNHIHRNISSYLNKMANNLTEITAEILDKMKELPEGVEIVAEATINAIQNEHESESTRLKNKLHELDSYIKNAKSVVSAAEDLILAEDKEFTQKTDNIVTRLKDVEKKLPICPNERFIYMLTEPKNTETASIEERLGFFEKISIPWRIEVKRIGSFRPDAVASSRFITSMCSAGHDEAWVVWQWGPNIYCIDKGGDVIKTIKAGCKVDDICTDLNGNLVISSHDARCIKILDDDYQVRQTINLEKVPRGVEFLSKDELVVCLVQNMHYKNGDQSSVMHISQDNSSQTQVCNSDTLMQPWRIAVNINGDICVSDRNKGSVMIFDCEGNLKCSYSGPDMSLRHAFAPHGICCDQYGQIFVVDHSNHTVHVLDPLCRFRGFLIMDQELEKMAIFMGTSSPFSITIDQGGDVWVGNKFGFITVLKYNI